MKVVSMKGDIARMTKTELFLLYRIPDEWVRESEYSKSKTVSIRSLQPDSIDSLQSILFPQQNSQYVRHKQRRKPSKSNT